MEESFFIHEEPLVAEFLSILHDVLLSEERDMQVLRHNMEGIFYVAFSYPLQLSYVLPITTWPGKEFPTLPLIRDSWILCKTGRFFSWKFMQDRFSSREIIFKRKVLIDPQPDSCKMCRERIEFASHLFVTCNFVSSVWYMVFSWLGFQFILKEKDDPKRSGI